jgi:16S rRNA pseudouridine516 synthase
MRLDKFLAEASIGTRKKVRNYVLEGKVTVNNQEIREPAINIDETTDVIKYLGKLVIHEGKKYYMFHKPEGCVTARIDEENKTIFDYFHEEDNLDGLFPVGRLDKDTEGLILITNDGDFNHRLMYPDKHVEKTYFFWAFGGLNQEDMDRLKLGISLGDDKALAIALNIEIEDEGLYDLLCNKMNIENITEKKKNLHRQQVVSGYITISEGRKHQVKRMLKAVGCFVVYLKRISIGGLTLDESLKKGHYRELTEEEVSKALGNKNIK